MTLVDIKAIQELAKKEMTEEMCKTAIEKLKTLYRTKEKATLALKNIDREIDSYLADLQDNVIYESSGIDTIKK